MEQIRTLTPRTAVIWSVLRAELDRRAGERLSVLDVGGGTGGFAVPLAEAGHRVTVVDASPDALAALTRRAAEAGVADRVRAAQGDADALTGLVEPATVDLVLCHSVLEVVDDPEPVMSALVTALCPGGAASVLVAGRAAAVFGRAMNGQLDAAAALAADPHGTTGGRDTLRRRYDAADASTLLTAAGLVVEEIHGVRVLADLLPAAVADGQQAALVELERTLAARSPYRDLAAQLHLFARRPA
ncbi:methyltransferase domain-containing protein [Micromonospora marina]|uniref:methyltransferase domain-containing protein n=1 Tax=Micromonospora marina TaxID=307120 RepID=UPI003D73E54D